MKTVGDKIIVKETDSAVGNKTKAGLYVPDTHKNKFKTGEVMAVGEFYSGDNATIKVGDKILFSEFGGTEVRIESETYTVIDMKCVLVIL